MSMKLTKISDRVYYLPATEETDRPVLGYVRGNRYSLMIDAGNSAKHVDIFHAARDACGLKHEDYVAITHWHWDHTFGMHRVSGVTVGCRMTNDVLNKVAQWSWTNKAMEQRLITGEEIAFCDEKIRLEYPNRDEIVIKSLDMIFEDRLEIDLGNIHCKLLRIGATHSDDSVVVHIPEEGVVFLGDAICGDFYHLNGQYDQTKLEHMIEILNGIDADVFISGHDEPCSKQVIMEELHLELEHLLSLQ